MITDDMLRQAASESIGFYIKSIESDYIPEQAVVPSLSFERKINRLRHKANHPILFKSLQRVASVLLALLITGAAWLTVDMEARATFITWIREIYTGSIIYRFFNSSSSVPLPEYRLSSLPKGFQETSYIYDEMMCTRIYEKNEDIIIFYYQILTNNSSIGLFADDYKYESVRIGPYIGDFYESLDTTKSNELLWIDSQSNIVFQISAFCSKDDIIALAEGISRN